MTEGNAWAAYMENTRRTEELQSEILKGAKAGEDPALLLIRCSRALSLVTNNPVFADEIERTMRAFHGHVFGEKPMLSEELAETRARQERIREALSREEDLDLREEMDQEIRAHQRRIEELEAALQGDQEQSAPQAR